MDAFCPAGCARRRFLAQNTSSLVLTLRGWCANIYKLNQYRGVEQLVARRAHNPEVVGSNPSPATTKVLKSQDFRTFSVLIGSKSAAHFRRNRADPYRDPNADISG